MSYKMSICIFMVYFFSSGSSSEEGEEGVSSLEEARKVIRDLRERHRAQAYQILAWRRRVKHQVIQ